MFRRTLIKLTLLNSIIFLILLALLGSVVYFYTKSVLYRSIDHSLTDAQHRISNGRGQFQNPQLVILYWDSNDQLIVQTGPHSNAGELFQNSLVSTWKKLKPHTLNKIVEKKVGNYYFRTMSLKVATDNGVGTVELCIIINAEKKVLHTLLVIILVSMVVGIVLALGAGFFLAQRALRPIKEAWERQQEFVSDASHEIRTPLTIIQSRIEMLLQTPRSMIQDKIQDISTSLQETRRLSKLVTHLLMLARTDANQVELESEPVLMNELVREVSDQFIEMAEYQEKTLNVDLSHNPITILGDKGRLHQLLVIFLDNALKFTPTEGEITLSCQQESNLVILKIKDTGIGIKPEDQKKIFNRFFQADTSRTNREGTGLGLSIAKWIVDNHKGKISVDSELGKGTTFTLSFPAYKSPTKAV